MHDNAILPEQRRALLALSPAVSRGFYLAGGTGLCLRLAHRRSFDLDLFREADLDPDELLRELQSEGLRASNVRTKPGTLWMEVEGVETSLMRFPYPRIDTSKTEPGFPVASLSDIAAMKIEAIASRGARKDFVDLYAICSEGMGLKGALEAFEQRFAQAKPDVLHRLKALTYFEDAEREPEPILLKPMLWAEVRHYFETEVRALFRG